ncbi:MAG: putative hemagglutinin-like (or adhesin-like) with a signal peptide and a putative in-like, partial [Verrucomicrobiales bacterium]|nr:putative hemagglutinin-like (or adhesin-like) with a signal peptide and a putative in-like [Verrucomicrobiales bacterium]
TLAANNTYTGGTNVGGGVLALGTGFGGGTTGSVIGPITLSNLALSGGQFVPNGTLVFNRAGSHTVANPINPTVNAGGFLEQWSTGELVLNQAAKVGGLRTYAGTTTLDFTGAAAPVSDIIDGNFTAGNTTIATARLTARNGNLTLKGKTGSDTVQSFALTDSFGVSTLTLQPGAGGTATLNLGALNRSVNSNDGGGVFFYNPSAGARLTTTDSGVNLSNPLLGPPYNIPYFVLNGSDWGARDTASNDIVPGSTLPGFHQPLSTAVAGANADYDSPTTISFDTTFASLRFNTSGGALTTDSTLQPNGILVTPAAGGSTTVTGGGSLRAVAAGGTASATTARDIVIAQMNPAGKLTIGVPITNFDANNRTELTKAGPGELELTSPNSYTGRTFVGGGIVRLTGGGGIGDAGVRTGSVFVRSGELILEQAAQISTGAFFSAGQRVGEDGTMTLKDSATFDIAADFNIGDVNSKGTVNVQDDARILTRTFFLGKSGFSVGVLNQTGGLVQQANTSAGDWNIGGNTAGDPLAKGTYNLSGGTFDTGARNFQVGRYGTGVMNISGGTVSGTAFHVLGRFGTGVGTLNLSGTGTYDAVPSGTGALYFIIGESGRGILNISGGATLRARNISLGHNGGSAIVEQTGGLVNTTDLTAVSGSIGGGIVFGQTPAPGLLLPDYSGSWHLQGGILRTYSLGENTALTTPFASSFRFDGGTLEATASNGQFLHTIDSVTVEDGGAVIDSAGFDIAITEPLQHDASLGATPDGGLTKNGAGSLTFSAANTYTGDTRVTGGSLTLVTGSLADAADVRLTNGATLDLAFSGTDTIDQFYIDGLAQAPGSWGSLASTATNKTERITSDGILNVTNGPSAATGYTAWAALPVNGLTAGVNDGPNQDPDGDGIANLTEFVLDGNPSQNSAAILPAATVNPTTLTVTFKRRDDAEPGNNVILQYSTELQTWTDIPIGPVSTGALTVTENGAASDDILVTIPRGSAVRQYVRLKTIVLP